MLTFSTLQSDLYGMAGVTSSTTRTDITTSVKGAIQRAQEAFVNYGNWSFLEQMTDVITIPLAAPYETGTITLTQDSKAVTGSGTTWTKDMEGSFLATSNAEVYEIRTFVSATSLTLAYPFQGTTASGSSYSIRKRFYDLPLNFSRPSSLDAKIISIGTSGQSVIAYSRLAAEFDLIINGLPRFFSVVGNTRRNDYYNTGTITVATSGSTSTWTVSTGTLPTDIVDREIRISGETRAYRIATRGSATTLTTYNVYVNPADATNTQATASVYAITPKETLQVGFSPVADRRYLFNLPYIKRLDEMISSTDISLIALAGYEKALVKLARKELANDGRIAIRADLIQNATQEADNAVSEAWGNELQADGMKIQAEGMRYLRRQAAPSWIN